MSIFLSNNGDFTIQKHLFESITFSFFLNRYAEKRRIFTISAKIQFVHYKKRFYNKIGCLNCQSTSLNDFTKSPTYLGDSSHLSARILIIAEPTITPSEILPISLACSGGDIPNPIVQGILLF